MCGRVRFGVWALVRLKSARKALARCVVVRFWSLGAGADVRRVRFRAWVLQLLRAVADV